MREGTVKAGSVHRGRKPWRVESPREQRARLGLNSRNEVADSHVEQCPEVEGRSVGLPNMGASFLARRFGACDGGWLSGGVAGRQKRREGSGVGNGVRLRERGKALKGEPHERIWHETRPAGVGRIEASRG